MDESQTIDNASEDLIDLGQRMQALQTSLGRILDIIPPGSKIALLDEPVNRNPGDHLIQWGSERFFSRNDIKICFRANTWDYAVSRARKMIDAETIVVCQGGGHLGDLYPRHQLLREQLLADFQANRIVILPQSIHFRSRAAQDQAGKAFRRHKDLHLFVRDKASLEIAAAKLCPRVYLAPDMAHALWPLPIPVKGLRREGGTLYLIRNDGERGPVPPELEADRENFCDWPDLVHGGDSLVLGMCAAGFLLSRRLGGSGFARRVVRRQARRLIARSVLLMAPCRQVISSRLHGVLLALLLGKRVVVLDSATGKLSAYHRTWLTKLEGCVLQGECEPA